MGSPSPDFLWKIACKKHANESADALSTFIECTENKNKTLRKLITRRKTQENSAVGQWWCRIWKILWAIKVIPSRRKFQHLDMLRLNLSTRQKFRSGLRENLRSQQFSDEQLQTTWNFRIFGENESLAKKCFALNLKKCKFWALSYEQITIKLLK